MLRNIAGFDAKAAGGSIRMTSKTPKAVNADQVPRIRQNAGQPMSLRRIANRNAAAANPALRMAPKTTSQGAIASSARYLVQMVAHPETSRDQRDHDREVKQDAPVRDPFLPGEHERQIRR